MIMLQISTLYPCFAISLLLCFLLGMNVNPLDIIFPYICTMEDAASKVLHLCTYVDLSIMTAVVMVAESRTTATKTTVAMMTLELELDVATSSEKEDIIINIYFKTLNGEYTPTAYKKAKRNCN